MQPNDFIDAVSSYRARFADSPPAYVFFEVDLVQAVDNMRQAVRVGRKLQDRIPPDDTVV